MKVLSMWSPWAELYVTGKKRIETRGWPCYHRGWTAIQATKGGLTKAQLRETMEDPFFREALKDYGAFSPGCIIGAVRIIACRQTERIFQESPQLDTEQERAFGDYSEGRYGIIAPRTFRLLRPIPFKSRQGKLLDLPEEIVSEIRLQWEEAQKVRRADTH